MRFLEMLAEAVNAVADWPNEWCWVADEPRNLTLGYQVGDMSWRCKLTDAKRDMPEIEAKLDQLQKMAKRIPLPLLPFPDQAREREILARTCLLKAAIFFSTVESRQETARWITFLGRLRADPSGRLITGNPDEEPVPLPHPRTRLRHM